MQQAVIVFADLEPLPLEAQTWRRNLIRRCLHVLRPGFRHCYVVLPHPAGGLTVLDPTLTGLRIYQLPGDGYLDDLAVGEAIGRCRLVIRPLPGEDWRLRLGARTCVGFVRNLLGLPTRRLVLTPWRLYRELTQTSGSEAVR